MPSTIKIKRSSVAGKRPTTSEITTGELALNTKDQKLFSSNGTSVFELASAGALANTNAYIATKANATNPTTSGLLAHTGRATISTNLAVSGNATVTGTMTATGIVSGLELTSTLASGDEGGQVNLAKPPNATINGGVTIDAYQNKLRIFEQGGSARGVYIDLSAASAGVGTNLLAGGGGSSSNGFSGILVGANVISADSTTDRLTFVAGSGIRLAANPTTDTITIATTSSAAANVVTKTLDSLKGTDTVVTSVSGLVVGSSGGGITWQSVQTSSFTAVAARAYPINTTSGAVTVTLPASPAAGDTIQLVDYAGTWATNNVTLGLNGNKLNGTTNASALRFNRGAITLVYIDSTQGWAASSAYIATNLGQSFTVSYLIVAGGGGGGAGIGGGGGAGGYQTGTTTLVYGTTYSFVVGGGGAGASNPNRGTTGSDSSAFSLTSLGGGGGGSDTTTTTGLSGGSGGGGGTSTGGSGTSGQGSAGGNGRASNGGGGGGGAGAVGAAASPTVAATAGNGGVGLYSSITGANTAYAGGGGGAAATTRGTGGAGGGGNGGQGDPSSGVAGSTNTGGGGGGARGGAGTSGAGGSGVVIISVPTSNYSGITTGSPTVTVSGSSTILRFTSSGSYTA